eukprot:768736-Hanusia_phi.AAC.1
MGVNMISVYRPQPLASIDHTPCFLNQIPPLIRGMAAFHTSTHDFSRKKHKNKGEKLTAGAGSMTENKKKHSITSTFIHTSLLLLLLDRVMKARAHPPTDPPIQGRGAAGCLARRAGAR